MVLDEKTVNHIWRSFGSFIAKQLKLGKGIGVPKFGNFTFQSSDVDLAVNEFRSNILGNHKPTG